MINTTCKASWEYFEDDESLKEMLGVYEKPSTPKRKSATCDMISGKQKDG